MVGLPGSGKSTMAKKIVNEFKNRGTKAECIEFDSLEAAIKIKEIGSDEFSPEVWQKTREDAYS
jgi:adenylate kinase family enzyme